MSRTKKNLFALLGWAVWRLLALIGVPAARRRLEESRSRRSLRRRR